MKYEKYQPSLEEMKKAEEMMTQEEIELSEQRVKELGDAAAEKLRLNVKLASGEQVYDKPVSHIHESVRYLLPEILSKIKSDNQTWVNKSVEIKEILKTTCVESTPEKNPEDEIFFAQRIGRGGLTRFVRNREPADTNIVTVILRKSSDYPESITPIKDGYTLATIFAGPQVEREPWDPWFLAGNNEVEKQNRQKLKEVATKFWSTHALVFNPNENPIVPETKKSSYDPNFYDPAFGK